MKSRVSPVCLCRRPWRTGFSRACRRLAQLLLARRMLSARFTQRVKRSACYRGDGSLAKDVAGLSCGPTRLCNMSNLVACCSLSLCLCTTHTHYDDYYAPSLSAAKWEKRQQHPPKGDELEDCHGTRNKAADSDPSANYRQVR